MLSLSNITKTYTTGDTTVTALHEVSIDFRPHEFVSVLGPSGCGKTTLLNIIGGLDRYDSGDLVISGRSTKEYRDSDWDTYRNHSVGFVFQSYNLIMHQTVLANVELALTLSGVSREERRARAIKALEQVGLGDQIHKKPNQMSGGQMQRVAIARALVNDPEIILADEPTGALDTATSVQIMEILKSISHEKLIIMVTHNPDLAAEYSSRIIRLLDGEVTEDTSPYSPAESAEESLPETDVATETIDEAAESADAPAPKKAKRKKKNDKGKRSMSFLTALSLSFNNLLTKKTRTLLVSFAGSIGIIGIALILALSNGVNLFIASVQEDTLSTYPLSIYQHTQDMEAMLGAMTDVSEETEYNDDMIHVDDSLGSMMAAMSATQENNLEAFKKYIDAHYDELKDLVTDIKYTYDFKLQIFTADGKTQVNPSTVFDNMGDAFSGVGQLMGDMSIFSEMINNQELLDQQYEVVAGDWPTNKNEVVLVVNENNQLSKMTLYMLGVLDQSELEDIMKDLMQNGHYDTTPLPPYSFEDFLGMRFKLLNTADFYQINTSMPEYTVDGKTYPVWEDVRNKVGYDQAAFVTANGIELKISGIVRPQQGVAATSISGAIGYTKALTDYILAENATSTVIDQQKNKTPLHNVLTGLKFEKTVYTKENIQELINTIDPATMQSLYDYMTKQMHDAFRANPPVNTETFAGFAMIMDDTQYAALITKMLAVATANPANTAALAMLFGTVQGMLNIPNLTVTADNLIRLLPLLGVAERYILINGITEPYPISGLHAICGATAMADIYTYVNEQLLLIPVNASNFTLMLQTMGDAEFAAMQETLYKMAPQTDATQDSVLTALGDAEKAKPASINFYAVDFESKEKIEAFIDTYNEQVDEADEMKYTDIIGIMMSSVTVIIDAISYVLIAFVSISLIVSSIMIGIITYISVLERTKEIGILRAIGASKRDISRVFNAETLIIGFAAGVIGIGLTLLFCIPINIIIRALSGLSNIKAALPVLAAFILVAISMGLTLIAGLIPSRIASKKDPVIALRSE